MARNTVAGKLPQATVVVLTGDLAGRRYPLDQARMIIGRTAAADIPIQDAGVSRQHLAIAAQQGRFLAVDLGSTNTSLVNGTPIACPVALTTGDVIRVGTIELRYEEEDKK
jgi:pSer/pThr/pTyr-binding forkhead associated (FHA) protein